jgi:hypothetical protein
LKQKITMTGKNVKSPKQRTDKGPIRYDPENCTYFVPDSQLRRLQAKYPYNDIRDAIILAGRRTKRYSENARRAIKENPGRALEFDLECWLFGPTPQQQAKTLPELAQQIRFCPTFVREALTGDIDEKLAGRDLAKFYSRYTSLTARVSSRHITPPSISFLCSKPAAGKRSYRDCRRLTLRF